MGLSEFDDAKGTLRWANEELDKLRTACQNFLDSKPYTVSVVAGAVPGQRVTIVRAVNQPGDDLRRGAYRVTSDLRNALDHATYAASVSLGTTKPNKTNFPSGRNLADLRKRLTANGGNFTGIPPELHTYLETLRPFPSDPTTGQGNDLLHALVTMANPNKHRIPLRLGMDASSLGIWRMVNVDYQSVYNVNGNLAEIIVTPSGVEPDFKANCFCFMTFEDHLLGREVCAAFRDMAEIVGGIILGLEAESERLLATSGCI